MDIQALYIIIVDFILIYINQWSSQKTIESETQTVMQSTHVFFLHDQQQLLQLQ